MSLVERVHGLMDLASAKKTFFVLAVVSIFLIPADGFRVYLKKPKWVQNAPPSPERKNILMEPEGAYLPVFDRGTLFGGASAVSMTAPQLSAGELIKDYRLKGIILGGEPEAIIEDAKTQRTLFVKTGFQLGDLMVKEIKEGQIVLSHAGGEIKMIIQ